MQTEIKAPIKTDRTASLPACTSTFAGSRAPPPRLMSDTTSPTREEQARRCSFAPAASLLSSASGRRSETWNEAEQVLPEMMDPHALIDSSEKVGTILNRTPVEISGLTVHAARTEAKCVSFWSQMRARECFRGVTSVNTLPSRTVPCLSHMTTHSDHPFIAHAWQHGSSCGPASASV